MLFRMKQLPYLPDFSKLIYTINDAVENKIAEVEHTDYLNFLVDVGILENIGGIYKIGNEWNFIISEDREAVKDGLRKKLEALNDFLDVIKYIGTEGKTYEEVVSHFNVVFTEQTIRVFLSWMEYINILRIESGRYYYNDRDEENEYEENNNRPKTNILDEIEVKDVKFSFFEYHRKLKDEQIVLNPDFQRNRVWKNVKKSQFIESAILGLPLPPIYFKKNNTSKLVIVDGLQRTTAIQDFMENRLRLEGLETLSMLNGLTFGDLKASDFFKVYVARLEDCQLFCYILQKSVPMSVVYDIFNRINTGGTNLSRQEIRNCLFIGKSTRLIKSLSENPIFRNAIDNGISKDRMKDREAVLRCLAFSVLDFKNDYQGAMDSFLEIAMKELNNMSEIKIQDIEKEFLLIMEQLTNVFGNKNFRIYEDYTRGRINIAVMETVYWCMSQIYAKHITLEKDFLLEQYDKMIHDQDYLFNVRNSTSSKSKVFDRFRIAKNYFIPSL